MIGIVGGGIAGTSLVKYLQEKGLDYRWFLDESIAASHISSGIINPISGRRYALAWDYEIFKNFALTFYGDYIKPIKIHKFYHPYSDEYDLEKDLKGKEDYLRKIDHHWLEVFHAYQVQVPEFINSEIEKSELNLKLIQTKFNYSQLIINEEALCYQDLNFDQIIFAEGIQVLNNPFFNYIPFNPNRGEALSFNDSTFQPDIVIHDGKFVTKFRDRLWIGSSFDRVSADAETKTELEFEKLKSMIPKLTKSNAAKDLEHLGAIRATTYDRRPFIGRHRDLERLFLFNGFGTKGVSLAPFFAQELIDHILTDSPLNREVDIKRIKS